MEMIEEKIIDATLQSECTIRWFCLESSTIARTSSINGPRASKDDERKMG